MSTEDITQSINDCQSVDPIKRSKAIYALNELEATEAIPVIIHLLSSDPDKEVRADAAFVLRFLGVQQPEVAGPALLKALDGDDEKVRTHAAESLGYLQYLPAASRLRTLLHTDSDWAVRASAAEALGHLKDEASVPDLQQAIADPDPQVQRYAVTALGQFIESPMVAPLIATQLSDEQKDPIVKAELLALSYRLGHQPHLQDLLTMLAGLDKEDDYEIATDVLMVLIDLTGENPPADLKEHQTAIQATLQKVQLHHPSLQSDIERVRQNLSQEEEHSSHN